MPDIPTLTDGHVTLRRPRAQDAMAMVEQSADPDSQRWTVVPRGYTLADAYEFLEYIAAQQELATGNIVWVIDRVVDGGPQYAGLVDVRWDTPLSAEIGYSLHPAHRGHGVMSDALRLVVRTGFSQGFWGTPLQRQHVKVEVGNWASRRVAWACGFTFHATVPGLLRHFTPDGGPALRDAWLASIGPEDITEPVTDWLEPEVLHTTTAAGQGLTLRPWRDDDTPWLDPHTGRPIDAPANNPGRLLLSQDSFSEWLTHRRERMATGRGLEWCIADSATDHALGTVGLFVRQGTITDTAELGYRVFPQAQRRGVATAAARCVVQHARDLGLRRLIAGTAADNAASNAVLTAAGLTMYGVEPAAEILPDGRAVDELHWHFLLT